MKLKIALLQMMMFGAVATCARAGEPRDAQARMTLGKLAVDAGRAADAERLFNAIAWDSSVPEALRCEARVREASAVMTGGDASRAASLYVTANRDCASQVEAMRLMVEAITGVEQDPQTWRGRTERVGLSVSASPHGSDTGLVVAFGDEVPAPPPAGAAKGQTFSGEPISISMKDANLIDVLRLLSQFTGLTLRCDPVDACERTVTLELTDAPWDQVLALVLQTNGLRYEMGEGEIRIVPNAFTKATGDAALLQTVSLCMGAYKADHGSYPVAADWTPVGELAALVEPMYVRTLPRFSPLGVPIVYRSADGTSFEVRVGIP